jgi:TIR domain
MATNNSLNLYSPVDVPVGDLPAAERVFISHRSFDKPLAAAVAALLESLGVHYWFDRDDEDTRRAAALGMAGDQLLVHAIERGVQHSSRVLSLLSSNTRGSWWVPYEIGVSRAWGRSVSFLVLESIRSMEALPEYVRLAANYWSVDELVRWAASLRGGHIKAPAEPIPEQLIAEVEQFVPRQPPTVNVRELSTRALAAIDRLAESETWESLRLTSTEQFDWLPSRGGLVRDLAYDLLAPLAFFRLNEKRLADPQKYCLQRIYRSITQHNEFAEQSPRLTYDPDELGWQQRRYLSPASSWRQGMRIDQLDEGLDHFLIVPDLNRNKRLATREEFKAEFDRIQRSPDEQERRRLGVLINPLFGFTPASRPVYWRVLAHQQRLHLIIVYQSSKTVFDDITNSVVDHFMGLPWGLLSF